MTQRDAYRLETGAAGRILRTPDGRVAYEYLTAKPEGSNLRANSACCFHPLNTPAGERITDLAPGDHVHHRGVFLAWHSMTFRRPADFRGMGPLAPTHGFDITRGDFWGWGTFAPTDGRIIRNRDVRLVRADASSAEIAIGNDWMAGTTRLVDERTTAIWRTVPGANVLDLTYRLLPDWEMQLDQTAFGGFCVRARNDGESAYFDAGGRVTRPDPHYSAADLNWPAADWYGYVITLKTNRTVGCAVIDHPANPPVTWHNPRYVWMLNPCVVAAKPLVLAAGDPFTLRYRVVTFDGQLPIELVTRLSAEFRG